MSEMMVPVQVLGEHCAECPKLEIESERLYRDGTQVVRVWRCAHVDVCRVLAREITAQVEAAQAGEGTQ